MDFSYTDFVNELNKKDAKYNASDKGAYVLVPLTYGIHYEIRGHKDFEIRVDFEFPYSEVNSYAAECLKELLEATYKNIIVFSGTRDGRWRRVVVYKKSDISVKNAVGEFTKLYEKTEKFLKQFPKKAIVSFSKKIFEKEISLNDEVDRKNVAETLARADKNREIEISMYWQRSAYFVVFIGAILTAYLSDNASCKLLLRVFLLSLGVLVSFIWYLTTRGAKYWQEHWEKMSEKIEAIQKQHIYSVYPLEDAKFWNLLSKRRYSVSRANSLIALIATAACGILAVAEIITFYSGVNAFLWWSVVSLLVAVVGCFAAEHLLSSKDNKE